jgi:glycosyltransferase involved in cell wall biosynthesis
MKDKKRVLILVVAYNAQSTIVELLKRFDKKTVSLADKILVADDASNDNTAKIAEEYKRKSNLTELEVIRHKVNKGYGGNQKWGYNYAIKKSFDIVVLLHGDLQYAPEQIPELIRPIQENKADFVFGSRIAGHPLKGGMPPYKFLGNKFLTMIENFILKTRLTEFHSGFRAYNVSALKDIPFNKNSDDFHFDSEIIIQLVMAKKKISEFTIPTRYGSEECNVNPILYGLNILKILGEYALHKSNLKKCEKFDIK